MVSRVLTSSLYGIDGIKVEVEVEVIMLIQYSLLVQFILRAIRLVTGKLLLHGMDLFVQVHQELLSQ